MKKYLVLFMSIFFATMAKADKGFLKDNHYGRHADLSEFIDALAGRRDISSIANLSNEEMYNVFSNTVDASVGKNTGRSLEQVMATAFLRPMTKEDIEASYIASLDMSTNPISVKWKEGERSPYKGEQAIVDAMTGVVIGSTHCWNAMLPIVPYEEPQKEHHQPERPLPPTPPKGNKKSMTVNGQPVEIYNYNYNYNKNEESQAPSTPQVVYLPPSQQQQLPSEIIVRNKANGWDKANTIANIVSAGANVYDAFFKKQPSYTINQQGWGQRPQYPDYPFTPVPDNPNYPGGPHQGNTGYDDNYGSGSGSNSGSGNVFTDVRNNNGQNQGGNVFNDVRGNGNNSGGPFSGLSGVSLRGNGYRGNLNAVPRGNNLRRVKPSHVTTSFTQWR